MFLKEDQSPMGYAVRDMIRRTEQEIFDETMGRAEPFNDDDGDFLDEVSQTEGWDGQNLSDSEQFETSINGHNDDNYDRPLALHADQELLAENQRLREQLDGAWDANMRILTDDISRQQTAEQRQAFKDQLLDQLLDSTPGGAGDRLIDQLTQQHQHVTNLDAARREASFEAAHGRYGDDFLDVANDMSRMDHNNPMARQIVQSIYNAPDPGEALMELNGNSFFSSLRDHRKNPPFLPGARSRGTERADRGRDSSLTVGDLEHLDRAGGDEADIFNSAMNDY
jgi:hypothetical protein